MTTTLRWVPIVLLLAGCVARYPMGLNQQQWDSLPPAQQAEFQAKQFELDAERQRADEARRQEQARLAAEATRAEQERLRLVYANAHYGDIVRVTVQGGFIIYAGKRYPYEPIAFDLAKGETKQIDFRGRGLQTIATRYNARLTDDGNMIYFDDSHRQRIVLVNQDWENGQRYQPDGTQNDVGVALAGMTFFVKFKDLPGAPRRIILERR